jgi:uncharacterized protein (DUF1697 family)
VLYDPTMPTHAALLRGINVGGRNRVAMAELRDVVTALGHTDVATYVASGNVVLTAAGDATPATLADGLERAIADAFGVSPAVVVVPRGTFDRIIADNPFPEPEDPRHVHIAFRADDPGDDAVAAVEAARREVAEAGGRDEAAWVGRTLYLHTPDGFGRSRLAELLGRGPALADATARNLRTVRRVHDMLAG